MVEDTGHTTSAEVLKGCTIWQLPYIALNQEAVTLHHELHGRSTHVAVPVSQAPRCKGPSCNMLDCQLRHSKRI